MGFRIAGLAIMCFVTLLSLVHAGDLIKKNGSVDLRCRIIGTRLSGTNHSPYFYKWMEKDGDFFLDPSDKPGRKVNGNVVTPAIYRLFYFLAPFRYDVIKTVWAIFQYVFFFASLFLLSQKNIQTDRYNFLPVLIIMVFYLYSNIWFYNIERGQMYTFYLFVISMIYGLYNSGLKYGKFMSGFVNAAAIFVRPLLGVFLFAGILQKDKKWIAGCICGGITGFLLFLLPVASQWTDYFSAMKEYSYEINGKQYPPGDSGNIPAVIEGATNLKQSVNFDCGGLSTVQYYLAAKKIHTDTLFLTISYCLIAGCCCFFYIKKQPALLGEDDIFLFAFFLYILAELFIIGYRGGYNQVEWIFGVFLILRKKQLSYFLPSAIMAAIILENIKLNFFHFQFEFAEIILICALFYMVLGESYINKMAKRPPK